MTTNKQKQSNKQIEFQDLSKEEQLAIMRRAAVRSNQMQRDLARKYDEILSKKAQSTSS